MTALKNIIFDLGDVIIPIDLAAPVRQFAALSGLTEGEVNALWKQTDFVARYETGRLDETGFRQHIRDLLTQHARQTPPGGWTDALIDLTWNMILLDAPVEHIDRILTLRNTHRVFLLSNTSPLHVRHANQMLSNRDRPPLETIFEQVFYSYAVGLAKPGAAIYRHVLEKADLRADETAFLDDNPANTAAAAALGIRAVTVVPPRTLIDYLNELDL
jgi:glucose-1-phosphatase